MTKVVKIPQRDRSDVEAEARAWIVQLDGASPSRSELREFREWLDRSPLHREVFEHTAAVWGELDGLSRCLGPMPAVGPETRRRFATPVKMLSAAAAAALAAVVLWVSAPTGQPRADYSASYTTSVGEVRKVSLPDGSNVQLNTGTRIQVAMDASNRLIRLDAGEAWFVIEPDPSRPLVVYARRLLVQVTGTAFSIRVDGEKVDLTVTEGHVDVASLPDAPPDSGELRYRPVDHSIPRMSLERGQHIVFDDGIELVNRMAPIEIERHLSWRDGMLIFDNDPLDKVVEEINRYSAQKIVISDSELLEMRFGGYFRVGDVSSILATFEEDFGIHVARINHNLVYLSRQRGG